MPCSRGSIDSTPTRKRRATAAFFLWSSPQLRFLVSGPPRVRSFVLQTHFSVAFSLEFHTPPPPPPSHSDVQLPASRQVTRGATRASFRGTTAAFSRTIAGRSGSLDRPRRRGSRAASRVARRCVPVSVGAARETANQNRDGGGDEGGLCPHRAPGRSQQQQR